MFPMACGGKEDAVTVKTCDQVAGDSISTRPGPDSFTDQLIILGFRRHTPTTAEIDHRSVIFRIEQCLVVYCTVSRVSYIF